MSNNTSSTIFFPALSLEVEGLALARYWVEAFHLPGWSMAVYAVPPATIQMVSLGVPEGEPAVLPIACCWGDPLTKEGKIWLDSTLPWTLEASEGPDMYSLPLTIRHEMLHILFDSIGLSALVSALAAEFPDSQDLIGLMWGNIHKLCEILPPCMVSENPPC